MTVLRTSPWRSVSRGVALGVVVSAVVLVVLVLQATDAALGSDRGTVTEAAAILGLDVVEVRSESGPGSTSTSLGLRPGAVLLAAPPVLTGLVAYLRRRRRSARR